MSDDLPNPKCKACGRPILLESVPVSERLEVREAAWDLILKLYVLPQKDQDTRAAIVQHYIAQGGPVPDSRAQAVRDALALKDFSLEPQTQNTKEVCQDEKTKPLN